MDRVVDSMATYAVNLAYEDLPSEVVARTKHLILDAVGCALGAAPSPPAAIARAAIAAGARELDVVMNVSAMLSGRPGVARADLGAVVDAARGATSAHVMVRAVVEAPLLGERLLRRLRYELVSRIMRFPLPHFRKVSSGELIPMITAEVEPLAIATNAALDEIRRRGRRPIPSSGRHDFDRPTLADEGITDEAPEEGATFGSPPLSVPLSGPCRCPLSA